LFFNIWRRKRPWRLRIMPECVGICCECVRSCEYTRCVDLENMGDYLEYTKAITKAYSTGFCPKLDTCVILNMYVVLWIFVSWRRKRPKRPRKASSRVWKFIITILHENSSWIFILNIYLEYWRELRISFWMLIMFWLFIVFWFAHGTI